MSQQPLSVSIVAPCRNEKTHVADFLKSVANQDMQGMDWELIVADGMSNDGTREALAEFTKVYPWLVVIDNPGKIVSPGLNAAIRQAKGDIIVRLDVHTIYDPGYVRACVTQLIETKADNVGGPAITLANTWLGRVIAASFHSPFSCGPAAGHDPQHEGYVDTVWYGCWRRDLFERVGWFDESLVRNQDDEHNLRIVRSGGKIWQTPKIKFWYKTRNSFRKLYRQYFQYGFWKVAVIQKHRIPASWRHLVPGLFVLATVCLPLIAGIAALQGSSSFAQAVAALWLGMLSTYGLATFAASIACAARHGWTLAPGLMLALPCYHFGYGTGFLLGILHSLKNRGPKTGPSDLYTELSR